MYTHFLPPLHPGLAIPMSVLLVKSSKKFSLNIASYHLLLLTQSNQASYSIITLKHSINTLSHSQSGHLLVSKFRGQIQLAFCSWLPSSFWFVFNLLWEYSELVTWAARVKWHYRQDFASLVCLFVYFVLIQCLTHYVTEACSGLLLILLPHQGYTTIPGCKEVMFAILC